MLRPVSRQSYWCSPAAAGEVSGLALRKRIDTFLTETNYLDIRQTDLYEICSDGRTLAVDERPKVIFSIAQGTLPWQPIFCRMNPHRLDTSRRSSSSCGDLSFISCLSVYFLGYYGVSALLLMLATRYYTALFHHKM